MQEASTPLPRPLLILKTGDTYEELRSPRGDFEHWVASGLGAAMPVRVIDARVAEQALPPANQISGVVVTGSHAMVSHREAWSERAAEWLGNLVREDEVPVLGICYGHQLLAHALGGQAGDHPVSMEIGTVQVEATAAAAHDPLFAAMPARFEAHVVHRQSALCLPPGAVRLAGNGFESNQAFRVGEQAWGVQFHPEFDEDAMRGYIDRQWASLENPQALRDRVCATPEAARLLERFGNLVAERSAAATAPAAAETEGST
ncbi:glutamine amidotransferase [Variovorax sp. OV329]|uniref:glutamine amidotransferase n=1 Tax=Variovorax sp. OV329 TaxID=1882825 RepID=UPI000B85F45A|nr:glutamine amidotransferase [Variovorax sp. OV329]